MPAAPARRLYRRPDRGLLAGVATGIGEHTGISPRRIRLGFAILAAAGGLGVALYGAYLIVLPPAPDTARHRLPRWVEYGVVGVVGLAAVGIAATSLPQGGLFLPTLLACLGGALIWRQASEPDRVRLRTLSRASLSAGADDRLGRVRLAAGAALVVAGAVLVLARADLSTIRDGVLAMIVTVVGLALITGPWWMRMVAQLSDERAQRIRSQERADIAAQLHDSVLQTLALIQRNAGSPREVARLARGQERELRTMLYDIQDADGTLGERLRAVAGEVEDDYAVSVEVVLVGDVPLSDHLAAVASAAREALVNAAKHSGRTVVSLYAEVETDQISVYVRDRGKGFDMGTVAGDRQGIRRSIIARVQRHGGRARVTSAAGEGTEVEIRLPRTATRTGAGTTG